MLVYDNNAENVNGEDSYLDSIPIFTVKINFNTATNEFWEVCIDSGAQRT